MIVDFNAPRTHDDTYLALLEDVLNRGHDRDDRTGVGARSLFGLRAEYDLTQGFPLLLTKRVHWHSVVHETLWMLRGSTNVRELQAQGVTIWDEWADADGDLGPVYGKQWRRWDRYWIDDFRIYDQIAAVLKGLRDDPNGRRHLVSAWNVGDLEDMALPPCHVMFQFYVERDGALSCQMYQRSADLFLGVPFNIAGYALITHVFAAALGRPVGRLIHVIGDGHIYANHFDAVETQLARPRPDPGSYPTLTVVPPPDWPYSDLREDHVTLTGYSPLPAIKAPVAV